MPTPECWEELGHLRAEVDMHAKQRAEDVRLIYSLKERLDELDHDRIRLKTIGGLIAFILTGIGVLFSDPIKKFVLGLIGLAP